MNRPSLLIEGPFESDYSLAIVNRHLAEACVDLGLQVRLHQRDNTTLYHPSPEFLREHRRLAPLFVRDPSEADCEIHSRFIYPPFTDGFQGRLFAFHCYGWEESGFPSQYVNAFNRDIHLITVLSSFVRDVLRNNGVRVPVRTVGCGADHILGAQPREVDLPHPGAFTFLHVSSGFVRKGLDILLRAYCSEFSSRDDVRLVVKTFPNPHNDAEPVLAELSEEFPNHAPIHLHWDAMSQGEMRWLYEHADCLVAPSRGEGFGLPVAEAMFLGCPVIATLYSGHRDICSEETCWPVEFAIEPARTHLSGTLSKWAEPRVESLRLQMRTVYRASAAEVQRKTEAARQYVGARFTWSKVVERHLGACEEVIEKQSCGERFPPPTKGKQRIGFITTWNTRCGIAEYSRYLVGAMPGDCEPVVFANWDSPVRQDESCVLRCWRFDQGTDALAEAVIESKVEAVSIQLNFGFFSPASLRALICALRDNGIRTAVTLHSASNDKLSTFKAALAQADSCICHRPGDVARLRNCGLRNAVHLSHGIPHGLPDRQALRAVSRRPIGSFVVSCFGFFLPPKGIHVLLRAFAMAKTVEPRMHLRLQNALYPAPESERYFNQCVQFIAERGLGSSVTLRPEFLEEDAVLEELAGSDLIVLPYLHSSESSSAAIRLPIASRTPVLCSDIEIFDEFDACIHRTKTGDAIGLGAELLRFIDQPSELNRFSAEQSRVIDELAWPRVAQKFTAILRGLGAPAR